MNVKHDLFVTLGDAIPREKEGGKAEKRVLPNPVEKTRRQVDHPTKTDTCLPGCQQGAQQGEETQNR